MPRSSRASGATSGSGAAANNPLASFLLNLPPPDEAKDKGAKAKMLERHKNGSFGRRESDPTKVVFLDIDGVLRPLVGSTYAVNMINIEGLQFNLT